MDGCNNKPGKKYDFYVKLRTLAFAPVLLLLAACGSEEQSTAVETVTVTEEASSGIDWNYIRSEYADTLTYECPMDAGAYTGACNGLRNAKLDTLRADVEQLPPSRSKTSMLESLADWDEEFDEYQDNMCLGTLNTGQLDCTLNEASFNMTMLAIEAIAENATD
ncbi:hypothetical protein [Rhodococcus gordoniae]